MQPKIAVDIVARDKTESGRKAAERSMSGFSKRTAATAREGGFEKLGRQVEGLTKFRSLSLGFDNAGRSLSSVGQISRGVASDVGGLTRNLLGAGVAGRGAMGVIATGAGAATAAVAGVTAAVVGLGVATYAMGDRWAKIGQDLGNRAKDFGMSAQQLQARRAAGERYGVSSDQTDAALEGLGSTLYEAKNGGNNLALGALGQLGLKLKQDGQGNIDVDAMTGDIADAIARQKNPQAQAKLAGIFGMSSMLPALRQGSAALAADGADYMGSGAALTDEQIAQAEATRRKTVRLRQHLGRLEKDAGMAAMGAAGGMADKGVDYVRDGGKVAEDLADGAHDLVEAAKDAGSKLVDGARAAAARLGLTGRAGAGGASGFAAFKGRIIGQESRGRQFDSKGRPLTSPKGAVGKMQVMRETGIAAARRAGIPWDEHRFKYDAAYNEQIGTAELSRLYKKYDGNEVLASAAYNAGEGRLDGMWQGKGKARRYYKGWLERFGDPRKGEISNEDFAAKIPFDETRKYAQKTADMSAGGGTAKVEIVLKGAPEGTRATVTQAPGMEVSMNVARSLDLGR